MAYLLLLLSAYFCQRLCRFLYSSLILAAIIFLVIAFVLTADPVISSLFSGIVVGIGYASLLYSPITVAYKNS